MGPKLASCCQIALMDFHAARYLINGAVPPQSGNDHPYVTPMGVVATKDGHLNLGVGSDAQWQAFCRAINRTDWAEDAAYANNDARFQRRAEIWDMLVPVFAEMTTSAWVDLLEEAGIPAGPINKMDEVFDNPQVQHLGMAAPCTHPAGGTTQVVAQPVILSRTPATIHSAAPDQGARSDDVLSDFGFESTEIEALRARNII